MRVRLPLALVAGLLAAATAAQALETGKYRFDPGGRIDAIRKADVNGDGRPDLLLLVTEDVEGGRRRQVLLVLETPATPRPGVFYAPEGVHRIPVDDDAHAEQGAVGFGRFGPGGAPRIRFYGPEGLQDLHADGTPAEATPRHAVPTLLARSPGRALVFWDAAADLDGDGVDETWFPLAEGNGALRVFGGTAASDRTLDLEAHNEASSDAEHLIRRLARVPALEAVDLEGDGKRELVAWKDGWLVAWRVAGTAADGRLPPLFALRLPFTRDDLGPEEIHTPRLQLADVDSDGKTDLLVTLVTGRRDQLGSLRTRLMHFPGPFRDERTGELVAPRVRIDTESVALHPRFVDLDGDGALDYVIDSIRGSRIDLIRRVMGAEPTTFYVSFRFDRRRGTFEETPYFTVERPYSREQAVSNRFGQTGWFQGDFDGDGHKDLLDLGNLQGVEILGAVKKQGGGSGDPVAFSERLQPRLRVDPPFEAGAVIADLDGNGLADAVLWSERLLYLILPERAR